jgi:hypothetical protein
VVVRRLLRFLSIDSFGRRRRADEQVSMARIRVATGERRVVDGAIDIGTAEYQ